GVLVARNVEHGTLAVAGMQAFVLADLHTVKVAFGIPDVALQTFRLGQVVPVTAEAVPGAVFKGRVSSVSPAADSRSRAYTVELTVLNPEGVLKSGMIAAIQAEDAIPLPSTVVPLSAVVHTAGASGYGVYVIESKNGNTVARLRSVVLGQVNGKHIMIQQGIAADNHIM